MPLENPYRIGGAYHYTVEALVKMGVNRSHKFAAFAARLAKVWEKADGEGWRNFKNREARNEATAKDLQGRLIQNCRVLQRIKSSYGTPLLKAGAVIDLTRDDRGELLISLNTRSRRPQKPGRAPTAAKSQPKPAKGKKKSSRKPTGGKKRAGNASGEVRDSSQEAAAATDSAESLTGDQPK